MTFLEKLQKLSVATRKTILWAAVIIISIIFCIFWIRSFQEKMKTFQSADFKGEVNKIKEFK